MARTVRHVLARKPTLPHPGLHHAGLHHAPVAHPVYGPAIPKLSATCGKVPGTAVVPAPGGVAGIPSHAVAPTGLPLGSGPFGSAFLDYNAGAGNLSTSTTSITAAGTTAAPASFPAFATAKAALLTASLTAAGLGTLVALHPAPATSKSSTALPIPLAAVTIARNASAASDTTLQTTNSSALRPTFASGEPPTLASGDPSTLASSEPPTSTTGPATLLGTGTSQPVNVPEPATLLVLAVGVIACLASHRPRRPAQPND